MSRVPYSLFSACAKTTVLLVLTILFVACDRGPQQSTEARVEAAIERKLEGWMLRRKERCRDAALAIALERADSMILDYARAQKLQLERPSRPLRPTEPPLRRPNDTLTLEPFLGDSL